MKNVELVKQRDAVKSAIDRAKDFSGDAELLGHWGKYVCVLTAGFLENTIRSLYSAYATKRAKPEVAAFVVRNLERVQNPKAGKFIEMATAFNTKWAADLTAFLDEDAGRRRNAVDSVMANRHLIAHGRSTTVSVVRVREYFDAAVELADFIEGQCGA